jgi:hypothetical protein
MEVVMNATAEDVQIAVHDLIIVLVSASDVHGAVFEDDVGGLVVVGHEKWRNWCKKVKSNASKSDASKSDASKGGNVQHIDKI